MIGRVRSLALSLILACGCATPSTPEARSARAGAGGALMVIGGLSIVAGGAGVIAVATAESAVKNTGVEANFSASYAIAGAGLAVGLIALFAGGNLISSAHPKEEAQAEADAHQPVYQRVIYSPAPKSKTSTAAR